MGDFANYIAYREKLYTEIGVYNVWRRGNPLLAPIIRAVGFPSDNLAAQVDPKQPPLLGQAALTQMGIVIVDSNTLKASQDGVLPPVAFPTP